MLGVAAIATGRCAIDGLCAGIGAGVNFTGESRQASLAIFF